MTQAKERILQRLPEPIRRDPKKSAVLAGLLVLMSVLAIRQFAGKGDPSKARAVTPGKPAETTPSDSVQSTASRAAGNALAGSGLRVTQWLGTPIKPLNRNLFLTKLEYFQRVEKAGNDRASIVADELFWDQLAKSLASQADQKKQKQIRSENLQLAASALRLQTTLMGSSPRALIDGKLVRNGDMIETTSAKLPMSFRVLRIEAQRIVIEREGVKLELRMGAEKARVLEE